MKLEKFVTAYKVVKEAVVFWILAHVALIVPVFLYNERINAFLGTHAAAELQRMLSNSFIGW